MPKKLYCIVCGGRIVNGVCNVCAAEPLPQKIKIKCMVCKRIKGGSDGCHSIQWDGTGYPDRFTGECFAIGYRSLMGEISALYWTNREG